MTTSSAPRRLPLIAAGAPDGAPSPPSLLRPGVVEAEDGGTGGQLLQVGDLARLAGKTVRAIHHYEELGLLKPSARSKGRFRLYEEAAVTRLRWIAKLNDLGMSLGEIQEVLTSWEAAPSAPGAMASVRAVYAAKLLSTRQQVARLRELEQELESSLAYLDTCGEACDPAELVAACASCRVHDEADAAPELVAGIAVPSTCGCGSARGGPLPGEA